MGAKRFGAKMLNGGLMEPLFTSSAHVDSTATVTFVNHSDQPVNVWLAYFPGNNIATIKPEDYIVFGRSVPPRQSIDFHAIPVEESHTIAARAVPVDAQVSVIAYGFEEEK